MIWWRARWRRRSEGGRPDRGSTAGAPIGGESDRVLFFMTSPGSNEPVAAIQLAECRESPLPFLSGIGCRSPSTMAGLDLRPFLRERFCALRTDTPRAIRLLALRASE